DVLMIDFCFFFQAEDGIRDFHVTGVQTCALPISALAAVERERPDLIILDVAMPGMDGFAVCRELRAYEELSGLPRTPVIFLTVQIGRASCRERVEVSVGGGSVRKEVLGAGDAEAW